MRAFRWALLTILGIATLASCGGGSSSASDTTKPTAATVAPGTAKITSFEVPATASCGGKPNVTTQVAYADVRREVGEAARGRWCCAGSRRDALDRSCPHRSARRRGALRSLAAHVRARRDRFVGTPDDEAGAAHHADVTRLAPVKA